MENLWRGAHQSCRRSISRYCNRQLLESRYSVHNQGKNALRDRTRMASGREADNQVAGGGLASGPNKDRRRASARFHGEIEMGSRYQGSAIGITGDKYR